MPQHVLVSRLRAEAPRGKDLVQRVIDGELDATCEESDRWIVSQEGRAAMRELGVDPTRPAEGYPDG
jgi:hypothetical protein